MACGRSRSARRISACVQQVPRVLPDSDRALTFGGETSATIAAGALLLSDPVELQVPPLADVAISFFLPGDVPASFGITGRYARQTNYVSPPGDFSAETVMPVGRITDDWYFVDGIDVLAPDRDRRHRGARRFADRCEHLHPRCVLPLA